MKLTKAQKAKLTALDEIVSKALDAWREGAEQFEGEASDMRDAFESRSEKYQESDKGAERLEKIEEFESLAQSIAEGADSLETMQSEIQSAIENAE